MTQDVRTLAPGDAPLGVTLGFGARAVQVNNFTSSYVRLPDAGVDVPPWVYGAVVVLSPSTNKARASLVPTTPAMPGPPVPIIQATLTWTDAPLTASAGHLLQQSTITQPQEIAALTLPGSNSSGTISLPVGTQSLAIVTVVASGDTSSMSLVGTSSAFTYYSQALGSSAYEIIGVESAVDASLTYQIGHGAGAGASFFITALPFPPPSFIMRTAPSYSAAQKPAPLNQNIGASSSFTWITPPAGRTLRLFTGFLHWRTATRGFGVIKGDGSTGQLQYYDQVATNFVILNFGAMPLTTNEKLLITNDDTGTGTNINGGLVYSLD